MGSDMGYHKSGWRVLLLPKGSLLSMVLDGRWVTVDLPWLSPHADT